MFLESETDRHIRKLAREECKKVMGMDAEGMIESLLAPDYFDRPTTFNSSIDVKKRGTFLQLRTTGLLTAVSGALTVNDYVNTLVASADDDVLIANLINPTFTLGAYTGVKNIGLKVASGSVWFDGTTGITPTSGAGTRFMWIPASGAIRAGTVASAGATYWDNANIGANSGAIGYNLLVSGPNGFGGGGSGNIISNTNAGQVGGQLNIISGIDAFGGGGNDDSASGDRSITLAGYHLTSSGPNSVTEGLSTIASAPQSDAGGDSCQSTAANTFTRGYHNIASWLNAVATGCYTVSAGWNGGTGGSYTKNLTQSGFVWGQNDNQDATSFIGGITQNVEFGVVVMGYATTGNTHRAQGTASMVFGQDLNALTNPNVILSGKGFTVNNQESFFAGFSGLPALQVTNSNILNNGDYLGVWDDNFSPYLVGKIVSYTTNTTLTRYYICIQQTTGAFEPPTNTSYWRVIIDGKIGINLPYGTYPAVSRPTAQFHIGGSDGSVTTAPIKLSSSVLMTVVESFAIENDDNYLYYTNNATPPVRNRLAYYGAGVTSIKKTGEAALTGAVTLTGGTNITLTQSGQDISIAAAGGGDMLKSENLSGLADYTTARKTLFPSNPSDGDMVRYNITGEVSYYPPAQNNTYVKATSISDDSTKQYFATDPAKSLIGTYAYTSWMSESQANTNQRFHIDLGSDIVIDKIYYENFHSYGDATSFGVKNFTLWGINSATGTTPFADLSWLSDEDMVTAGWTKLTTSQLTFDQHTDSDIADPKSITITNTTAYRYYAFKFVDSWSGIPSSMGIRRIELQRITGDWIRFSITKTDVGLGNVENTALSTWVGSSNIVTIGTITSGGLGTGAVIGSVTMTLGSDDAWDMYCRSNTGILTRIPTVLDGVLVTSATGVPSISTNIPTAVTIGSAYIYRVGGTDIADNDIASAATWNGKQDALGYTPLNPANNLSDVTAATARTNLGLAIGTDVQAQLNGAGLVRASGTAISYDTSTYLTAAVTSIKKTGEAALTGAVTLTGGTNITLTQSGQDISIAAEAGGGGGQLANGKYFSSTDNGTTSTTFVDTIFTVTITTGTAVLVCFGGSWGAGNGSESMCLRLMLNDTVAVGGDSLGLLVLKGDISVGNGAMQNASFSILVTGLTAGSNKFELQFKSFGGGTVRINSNWGEISTFSVISLG